MTPAERIAAAMCRAYNDLHAIDRRTLAADDEFDAEAAAALDALMDGHDDVHLHRHPDGTITAVPMQPRFRDWDENGGGVLWSDDLAGGRRRLICPRCKGFADDPAVLHSPQGCYGIGSLRTDLKETP